MVYKMISLCPAKKRIAIQTPYQRVLFVALHEEHRYGSQDEVQDELDSVVMDFAPPGVQPTDKVRVTGKC